MFKSILSLGQLSLLYVLDIILFASVPGNTVMCRVTKGKPCILDFVVIDSILETMECTSPLNAIAEGSLCLSIRELINKFFHHTIFVDLSLGGKRDITIRVFINKCGVSCVIDGSKSDRQIVFRSSISRKNLFISFVISGASTMMSISSVNNSFQ